MSADTDNPTVELILDCAREEFMEHGFRGASLNGIIRKTGYTKGAFYYYFESKEALFDALVRSTSDGIIEILRKVTEECQSYPAEERMYRMSGCVCRYIPEFVDFIIAHRDETTMLITGSQGTRYDGYMDMIRARQEDAVMDNIRRAMGSIPVDDGSYRTLIAGYFSMYRSVLLTSADREEMISRLMDIQLLYERGIIGLFKYRAGAE